MVKQYPHTFTISWLNPPAKDENGDWVESSDPNVIKGDCRAEGNMKGDVIRGDDGSIIGFSFLVYMPTRSDSIPFGAKVEIKMGSKTIFGTVKGSMNGQLNTRVWV